jgi:hypothetical protein
MIYRRILHAFLFIISLSLLESCEKFSGDQTVPSYISLDSITLHTDYVVEGSASHAITDGWVYVDGELIGAFQLPVRFPVLKEGVHTVSIKPGIKKNGIAETREAYPFFNSLDKKLRLTPDSTTRLGLQSTTYMSNTKFLWKEDFDGIAISLDTTKRSSVGIKTTTTGSGQTFEGLHSGIITMDSSLNYFECVTHDDFVIPAAPVYLEMNYNINNELTIGMIITVSASLVETTVMNLFPTNGKWKKIYIDLTTTLNAYSNSSRFQMEFFSTKSSAVSPAVLLLDNMKLVTR